MKRKTLTLPIIILFVLYLFSCNDANEDITKTTNTKIEYKELTSEEVILKNQLADAANIVVEIASDKDVLNEIVATIKVQPRIMEDRVKFADLMNPKQELKSGNLEVKTGIFSAAFKDKLSNSGLKSASNLIESLSLQGIEVYIPWPIEDYPEGTDIIVTSHPLDNIMENIGYFINSNEEIMATEELAKKYPVIIITTPLYSEEELQKIVANRASMDQYSKEIQDTKLKSTNSSPTNWYDESVHYGIYIPKIYCTNDHVSGLFGVGYMYITGGTVTFDVGTKLVLSNIEEGTFGFSLPRKYEGYAQNGWYKGWFDCNIFLWQDWQPAITKNTIAICIDVPNATNTLTTSLAASWLQKETLKGVELSLGGNVASSCSTVVSARDFLYGSTKLLRERYITDYNSSGVVWGSEQSYIGTTVGDRPAISFSTELKYATYCETW